MKVIIAGGRNYSPRRAHLLDIRRTLALWKATEIVSGYADGADLFGEVIAGANRLKLTAFPAHWERDGKGAGHKRNARMAQYADALIALPGGRGTANMIAQATKSGLPIAEDRTP